MVGDGIEVVAWMRWLSPFGLLALSRPFEANRVMPLIVMALVTGAVLAATAFVAVRRDIRGGWFAPSTERNPRLFLLQSVGAYAGRRLLRALVSWSVGVGSYFLLIGMLARSMTKFLTQNPLFADVAAQAGFSALGSVTGYVATLLSLLAIPI